MERKLEEGQVYMCRSTSSPGVRVAVTLTVTVGSWSLESRLTPAILQGLPDFQAWAGGSIVVGQFPASCTKQVLVSPSLQGIDSHCGPMQLLTT